MNTPGIHGIRVLIALGGLVAIAATASAQSRNGSITGTVTGATDPRLNGPATIRVHSDYDTTKNVGSLKGDVAIQSSTTPPPSHGHVHLRLTAGNANGAVQGWLDGNLGDGSHFMGSFTATFSVTGGFSNGTIGANPSTFELGMLLGFGLLGYVLRLFGYPIAPVVVGLILGPLAEQQLRRALSISQGDPTVLVHSWIAVVLLLLAAAAVIVPLVLRTRGRGEVLAQVAGSED